MLRSNVYLFKEDLLGYIFSLLLAEKLEIIHLDQDSTYITLSLLLKTRWLTKNACPIVVYTHLFLATSESVHSINYMAIVGLIMIEGLFTLNFAFTVNVSYETSLLWTYSSPYQMLSCDSFMIQS